MIDAMPDYILYIFWLLGLSVYTDLLVMRVGCTDFLFISTSIGVNPSEQAGCSVTQLLQGHFVLAI